MTVDGSLVGDRLRPLLASRPGIDSLLAQLSPGMADTEYSAVAIAIIRVLAATEAPS